MSTLAKSANIKTDPGVIGTVKQLPQLAYTVYHLSTFKSIYRIYILRTAVHIMDGHS